MSTYAGCSKVAAIKLAIGFLTVLAAATACTRAERSVEGLSIAVSPPETQTVDMDLVIANAQQEVEALLPGAQLTFYSLVAECEDLTELIGEVNLFFTQTRRTLFGGRVSVAHAVVDTAQATLAVTIRDETEHFPSTEPLVIAGMSVVDIAGVLQTHMEAIGMCGTTLVLARSDSDGPWRVRCGPPDQVFIECLEIDPTTGEITELR